MISLYDALYAYEDSIGGFANQLSAILRYGEIERVFTAGNGGSSSIASHLVADIMKTSKRFDLPSVICLSDNVPLMTAIANDVSYDDVFSEAANLHHIGHRDAVIIVSSSGNSKNVVNLARMAVDRKARLFTMTGFTGGALLEIAKSTRDAEYFHAAVNDYGVVEDLHHHVIHRLVKELQK